MCNAEEDPERYAHPKGEDYFGPRYEVSEEPSETKLALDEEGKFIVPDFIDLTMIHEELDCWVTDQIPTAGTVMEGVQTFNVHVQYTCDGFDEYWARVPIELKDITPPEIGVLLDANDDPQISFGGVQRYVSIPGGSGVAVAPIITVSDGADVEPVKEYLLNGNSYLPGTPITAEGLYILNVSAEDASGNKSFDSRMFEIRPRPSHTAAALVESASYEINPGGQTATFTATVVISDDSLDHAEFYLPSIRAVRKETSCPCSPLLSRTPLKAKRATSTGTNWRRR